MNVAPAFGGPGEDTWSRALCDAPTSLYALLALGLAAEPGVQTAVDHRVALSDEVGWRRRCGPELGKFRGVRPQGGSRPHRQRLRAEGAILRP